MSLSCSRNFMHDTWEWWCVCLRLWGIMFSWVGGVVSGCVLSAMRWILHPMVIIKIKTNLVLHSLSLAMTNEWMNNTLLLHMTSEHHTDLDYNQACSHIWPRSLGWNGVCTFESCVESRPCCAPIVYSLPRATVHPEPDHKFLSVSWGWRFSCQGESWDSLNSHWRIWPLRQGGEIRMDCRKCKSV